MNNDLLAEEIARQKKLMVLNETPKPKSFYQVDVVFTQSTEYNDVMFEEGKFPFTGEGVAKVLKTVEMLMNEYDSSLQKITITLT